MSATALVRSMQAAAEQLSLPWRGRHWRGHAGSWLGVGSGSSIDFQDHRPYLPGDDPRYIDWRAYARSGQYIMKLYREEVSPLLDLVLDASASMALGAEKQRRSLELFAFCAQSARRSGAALRCFTAGATGVRPVAVEQALAAEDLFAEGTAGAPRLAEVPWRPGSMRVLVSDLLFPGVPEAVLAQLSPARVRGVIFAPRSAAEAQPDWSGNLEIVDCESRRSRVQAVSAGLLARYRENYARHFALWREQARRHEVAFATVPAEPPFLEALRADALPAGAVEFT
jgi:uncharacterized protein (DUF58 family)